MFARLTKILSPSEARDGAGNRACKPRRRAARWGGLLLCATILLAASAIARTQQNSGAVNAPQSQAKSQSAPNGNGDLINELQLTPEQLEQIRQIKQQNELDLRPLRQQRNRARLALEAAIANRAPEAVVQQRTKDLADANAAIDRRKSESDLQILRVLTPEQVAHLRELRRARRLQRQMQNRPNDAPVNGAKSRAPANQNDKPANQNKSNDAAANGGAKSNLNKEKPASPPRKPAQSQSARPLRRPRNITQ